MSAENTASPNTGALEQKIALVERDRDAILAAMARSARIRLFLILAVIGFLCIVGWTFYSEVQKFTSDENLQLLAEEAQNRLSRNSEDYQRELQELMKTAQPVLTEAAQKQLDKDMPRYMDAMDVERKTLADNLEQRLNEQVKAHYTTVMDRNMEVLKEKFPSAQDEEVQGQMMANVQDAVERLVKKYYVDEFETQLKTMEATWESFPVASAPPENESLEDQLFGTLFELMALKVANQAKQTSVDQVGE